jgi:tetratricopeptide (TPR) repeat protein
LSEYGADGEKAAGIEGVLRPAAHAVSAGLLDNPLHARALERLSRRERSIYRHARAVLAAGRGADLLPFMDFGLTGAGVYEALLGRSWAVRFDNPREMVGTARLAVEVSLVFDPRKHGAKRVADLRARAEGELANACRVADDLTEAQRGFGRAYGLFHQGTGNPYLRARLLDMESSLLGTGRQFALALERLTTVSDLYRDLGEAHLAGRALITRGLYASYSGNLEGAVVSTEAGLAEIDCQRDPVLFMTAKHNQLLFLVDLKRYHQAKRALFEARQNLFYYKERITALRLRWVEGRIFYGLRELLSAEIAFREVKAGMDGADMGFHAALTSLDLAAVLLRQERTAEAEDEVIAAREIFLAADVYLEYLGSIIFLHECFRQGKITAETIEETVAYLRRQQVEALGRRR